MSLFQFLPTRLLGEVRFADFILETRQSRIHPISVINSGLEGRRLHESKGAVGGEIGRRGCAITLPTVQHPLLLVSAFQGGGRVLTSGNPDRGHRTCV